MTPRFVITQHPETGWDTEFIASDVSLSLPWRPCLHDCLLDLSPLAAKKCPEGFTVEIVRRRKDGAK
jgi:hypothetical protein